MINTMSSQPARLSFPKRDFGQTEVGLLPPEGHPNRGEAQTPQNSEIDDILTPPGLQESNKTHLTQSNIRIKR